MDWLTEKWVKLYTRDSADWLTVSLAARGLFYEMLRKADRKGCIYLGRKGPAALAVLVRATKQEVEPLLQELVEDGCVTLSGGAICLTNFIEAQDAVTSNAQRQERWREKQIAERRFKLAESLGVTVTRRNAASRDVTTRLEETRLEEIHTTMNVAPEFTTQPTEPDCPLRGDEEKKPPRRPRKEPTGPLADCFKHWRDVVWPRVSSAPYPTKQAEFMLLAKALKTLSPEQVMSAMDRAAEDDWWRDKLDLSVFCSKISRFLTSLPLASKQGPRLATATPSPVEAFGQGGTFEFS